MSGSWHSYNTEPVNFNYQVENYASPYGKIAGVGCDGTKSGVDATLPKYSSPFKTGGSSGYSATDVPVGPVAGPKAPYSIIEKYNDNTTKFRNDFAPQFPAAFKGGKSRRMRSKKHVQYGCSKTTRGGKKYKSSKYKSIKYKSIKRKSIKHKRSKHKCSKTCKHTRRRSMRSKSMRSKSMRSKSMRSKSMRSKSMRGGMSSASDYTEGRDTSQDQPYGNKAYSFGQGLDSMLGPNESALASPPPFLPYNDCGKVMRN